MNQAKTVFNNLFYNRCDGLSRAIWKIKEYDEKMRYYERKLVGYKGVVSDQIKIGISFLTSDDMIIY